MILTPTQIRGGHRGTMIEMEVQRGQKYSNELAKSCFESMKELVDLYKEKIC